MSCSVAWRTLRLRITIPSARSARMPTSLAGSIGAPSPDCDAARVDHDVVGRDARPLDLEVAANARPEVGDPVPVLERRVRRVGVARLAAQHRDQVLVVGAVELPLVGERAVSPRSFVIPYCAQLGSYVGAALDSGSV